MANLTARLTDVTNHGAIIISASHNTFTSTLPNARISDLVACPIPGHGINPIVTGAPYVFTNNLMQSRIGDFTACGGMICNEYNMRYIGNGGAAGDGAVVIGAIHDPDTNTTIVYTREDDPENESTMEKKYKPAGDSSAGVSATASGKPITSEPSQITEKPTEVTKNTVTDKAVEPVVIDSEVDYSMQLSPNFKLSDLTTNVALGKNRVTPQHGLTVEQIINNLKRVAVNCLEPMAEKYGRNNMIITSGFRLGTSTSQHERGMAVDVQFKGQHSGAITNSEMVSRATDLASNTNYDQLILEYLGNKPWIHVSYSESKNRRAIMSAVKGKGFIKGIVLA